MRNILISLTCSALLLTAHPLGNFSANHYMKFETTPRGVEMRYVMDLAEIPTFELLRDWGLERTSSPSDLERKGADQARVWMANLSLRVDGKPVRPVLKGVQVVMTDGAGNLPIVRITTTMFLAAAPGRLEYEDHNYEGRAGWKEIVITSDHARIAKASQGDQDRSQALTAYPPDPMAAPPQDLRAEFQWTAETPVVRPAPVPSPKPPVIVAIPQPASKPALPPAAVTTKNVPVGSVVKNDFLSRLLHRDEIPFHLILAALLVAFGLGAAHALTPGHGKTIVAAYLVGSRGTMKHAVLLGAMVTFTHTISVFALGLATLFLFRFIVPEKIAEVLGVISGLSIAIIGGGMLLKRLRGLQHRHHHHHHDHVHEQSHTPDHDHHHDHVHDRHHDHAHTHSHGAHSHTHHVEGEITWGNLITLAVSGGLVPCESALVLLLSAIALGRVGLGLLLLISFSLGLAGVLMGIGAAVLCTKRMLPERTRSAKSPWMRWVPVASSAVVVVLGVLMTSVSLGWLPTGWLIG